VPANISAGFTAPSSSSFWPPTAGKEPALPLSLTIFAVRLMDRLCGKPLNFAAVAVSAMSARNASLTWRGRVWFSPRGICVPSATINCVLLAALLL
jgi:hypothetical protein